MESREADIKAVVASIQKNLDDLAGKAADEAADSTSTPTIYHFPISADDQAELRSYKPAVLPIGPYHQHKKHLETLDRDKMMLFHDLLSRAWGTSLEECVMVIMALEQRARSCSKDTYRLKRLSRREFVEVLLMDGCSIIELLYKFYFQGRESTLSWAWSLRILWIDLLKLENQIPFFVLEKLFELLLLPVTTRYSFTLSRMNSKDRLRFLVVNYLKNNKAESWNFLHRELASTREVHTLLHLYYLCSTPGTQEERQSYTKPSVWVVLLLRPADRLILFLRILAEILMTMIFSPHRLLRYILMKAWERVKRVSARVKARVKRAWARFKRQLPSIPRTPSDGPTLVTIPCATQLEEDGVKFAKKRRWTNLCDITFSRCRGIMQIPQLYGETIALFANLIAYEQRHHKDQKKYIINYVFLMGCLINSPKDVAVLRKHKIIDSQQDDKELADLFNQICRRYNPIEDGYYDYCYNHLSNDVKEYRKFKLLRWRVHVTKLKQDYFSNPWALISFLAVVVLLCLNIAQTFFTIYPYYYPR